jgi:trk system potassium uptake protein TrkA
MLLAVTDSDEINLMACTFTNMLAPGLTKLARIRNDEYTAYAAQLAREIGIGIIINPEVEVVRTIEHMLRAPGAVDISDLAGGRIKIAGTWIAPGNPLVGIQLMDLRKKAGPLQLIVAAIIREDKVIVPAGSDGIREGDLVYFVCEDSQLQSVFAFLGNRSSIKKSVLVIGGGNIGLRLARSLEKKPIQVKLLDKDPERCAILAGELGRTLVLNGDGTDQEALLEENIGEMDVVVTMTGNEESNILASLLAKKLGTPMTITRLNKIEYMPLACYRVGAHCQPASVRSEQHLQACAQRRRDLGRGHQGRSRSPGGLGQSGFNPGGPEPEGPVLSAGRSGSVHHA